MFTVEMEAEILVPRDRLEGNGVCRTNVRCR